ncbi:hypothetical protein [Kribbella qitaiheensis]|nr:hypothetical protein [Kribbella qitaiheensis]
MSMIAASYLAYFVAVVAFPGTVFWRRLTGGTAWFAVDAILGAGLGLALEVLVYPVGRWLDVPLLPLLLTAFALGLVVAFPARASTRKPFPWWAMAGLMVSVGVASAWYLRVGSHLIALDGPAANRPNSDSPFQLSLGAELTHHFPPQIPYVAGEPLQYHWMAYNHTAAAHWITGIELDVLTHRFVPFSMILMTALGAAAVAVVLAGRAVAAPIGAGLTVLAGDLAPWPWAETNTLYHDSPLSMGELISATQAFSTVLLLPLIGVTALILRRSGDQSMGHVAGLLVVAAVLIAVLSASKATALPVYGAGLAFGWLYSAIRRRFDWRITILGLLSVLFYGLNYVFIAVAATALMWQFSLAQVFFVRNAFWDQEKLQLNDLAFTAPTKAVLETLRTKYGVRWLLFDERVNPVPAALNHLATPRRTSGTVHVYELATPPVIPTPRP